MNTTYVKDVSIDTATPSFTSSTTSNGELSPTDTQKEATTTLDQFTPTTSAPYVAKNPGVLPKETVASTPSQPALNTPKPTPKPTASATEQTITPLSKLKWGVFTGSNPTTITEFEKKVDENPDYLAYFVHWGNGEGKLPTYLYDFVYKKDRTLVLFWEASDYKIGGTDQPLYSYSSILDGAWDSYFKDFAIQLRQYKGPIILVPFSELNGNWTPWSGTKNGNTPQEAVLAWRHVHGFFNDVPNVSFGFAVNAASVPNTPENHIDQYYPGDAYVDYIGVDGFNMGTPWLSFDAVFKGALTTLSKYNKPTLLFSFATAEGPQKSAWLHDALHVQLPKYPFVKGWIYFNQHKERNWLLWSDQATFDVFLNYISS